MLRKRGGPVQTRTTKRCRSRLNAFRCTVEGCGYTTAVKEALVVHTRTHTGEKPFVCNWRGCKFAAAQKCNLVTHLRTHTGEKPYFCTVEGCNYASARTNDLTRHIRKHTGEKPYLCTVEGCDYAAGLKFQLEKHAQTKHSGKNDTTKVTPLSILSKLSDGQRRLKAYPRVGGNMDGS